MRGYCVVGDCVAELGLCFGPYTSVGDADDVEMRGSIVGNGIKIFEREIEACKPTPECRARFSLFIDTLSLE
jgi:hypothetical protein